jgi:Uri superfamily endonuclease
MVTRGLYCLCIFLKKDLILRIGAIGERSFPAGKYVYIGSAMNGIEARIRRHFKTDKGLNKKIHWHIDYLLQNPEAKIESVYITKTRQKKECSIASSISEYGEMINRFGSSDCDCPSHLFKINEFNSLVDLGLKKLKTRKLDIE